MGITLGLLEWNKLFVNKEAAFRENFNPVVETLKQAALEKNSSYGKVSQEALELIKESPHLVIPSEFALISEGLQANSMHQESLELAGLALQQLEKFKERFRYLRMQGRSFFETGQYDSARIIFASTLQLVKDNPDFDTKKEGVNRLAVLLEWMHGELDQLQCEQAYEAHETIKDINGRILNAFSTFVEIASARFKGLCQS